MNPESWTQLKGSLQDSPPVRLEIIVIIKLFLFKGRTNHGRIQQKNLNNIIAMCTNKLSFILSVFAFFFIEELITSCSGLKEPNSEGAAELRLYWIGDSHPHNTTNT